MSDMMADIFKRALDLDDKDRAFLAGLLIYSLEAAPDEGLEEAWRAEIDRRVSELVAGSVELISWDELKEKLFNRGFG